jgi:hypothetical protein
MAQTPRNEPERTRSQADAAPRRRRVDRRVRRSLIRFPERRSGFERRGRDRSRIGRAYDRALLDYRSRPYRFLLVLATITVFNFLDFMLTIRALQAGSSELNPVMARLFSISPTVAAVVKLGAGGLAVTILLALRRYKRTLEASLLLLIAFSVLMVYHGLVWFSLGL